MRIEINKIDNEIEMKKAWAIRHEVFVIGQNCPEELEWEFEEESVHFLAKLNDEAVGTARYRKTEKGIKLERFAVLESARGNGVGSALVAYLLDQLKGEGLKKYLHAQLAAAGLYSKHGFKPVGAHFWEAGIEHIKMERN